MSDGGGSGRAGGPVRAARAPSGPRRSGPEVADVDDDRELVLEDLTREHVLDYRTRAVHDHQIVHDHVARYGEHSAQRLFTRSFVAAVQRLSGLGHLDFGYTPVGAGMSGSEVSGVDLARVALRAAMEAARANGGGWKTKVKLRIVRTVRRDGREPMGLRAAIGALVTERAWELPAADAALRERWAALASELAGHPAAVSYDADSGQLTVCPESSAWATKARLEQARISTAANQSAGGTVVHALRIPAPGTVAVTEPADANPEPVAAPAGPPRSRETASDGYRRALSARRKVALPSRVDPRIAEGVERQTAAMRELSRRAFSEGGVVVDDALGSIKQARTERRRQADVSRAAALRRARAERAWGRPGRRPRSRTRRLGRTA
ncbi:MULTISPECIES: DciA family protein [unclassified Streptomyces]|uniref:DciA family protein n=1 Tax=unclassified Streptomyces TaxID=2593676 RepID=UPI000DC444C8|nr:DciA family protein [Streptomyces sp. PsTaAH-130]RAJ63598.1 uncharacterized protein DUF721 [Streptomyces sp. PsTaAH-130]